jgi:hypothetical protein
VAQPEHPGHVLPADEAAELGRDFISFLHDPPVSSHPGRSSFGICHGAAKAHWREVLASDLGFACRYYSIEFELLEVSGKTVMGATYIQVSVFRARWQGDWCWVGSGGGSCNWRGLLERRQQDRRSDWRPGKGAGRVGRGGRGLGFSLFCRRPARHTWCLSNKNVREYGKRCVLLQEAGC